MHRQDLPPEDDGRAQRPARASQNAQRPRARRRGDGDTHRAPRRRTFDLFAIVKQIVDAKAQFRSLAEPWADTGTSTRRLLIAVLGGLPNVERDVIRTRTAEGPQPGGAARTAHRPTLQTDRSAEGGSAAATSRGRNPF